MAHLHHLGQDRPSSNHERRLWSVAPPPPPLAGHFEGFGILNEIPDALGLILFEWVRAADLWATMDAGTELFRKVTGIEFSSWGETILDSGLQSIAGEFRDLINAPERIRAERLAEACTVVSDWAREQSNVATAAAFAEAAARVVPADPDLCFRAGRANRHNAALHRAILWFNRGTGLARRIADWPSYIDSYLGWANVEIMRGNFQGAERLLHRSYRTARKYNLRVLGAAARHDLFMLCVDQRRYLDAYRHASEALTLYDPDDEPVPYLVHDIAQTWALEGYGDVALPILQAVRRVLTAPADQLNISGNIAGAAGKAGDLDTFYDAWRVVDLLGARPVPFAAGALNSVAEGAFALRLYRQASEVALQAHRFAEQRQEVTEAKRSSDLLDRLRRGEPPVPPREPPEVVREMAPLLLATIQRTESA